MVKRHTFPSFMGRCISIIAKNTAWTTQADHQCHKWSSIKWWNSQFFFAFLVFGTHGAHGARSGGWLQPGGFRSRSCWRPGGNMGFRRRGRKQQPGAGDLDLVGWDWDVEKNYQNIIFCNIICFHFLGWPEGTWMFHWCFLILDVSWNSYPGSASPCDPSGVYRCCLCSFAVWWVGHMLGFFALWRWHATARSSLEASWRRGRWNMVKPETGDAWIWFILVSSINRYWIS